MKKSFLLTLLLLLVSFTKAQVAMPTLQEMQTLQMPDDENRATHWQPVDPPGSTGMTATLVGYVEIDGVEQRSTQLEVGIFHGEVCRGTDFVSVYIPNQDRYLLYCSFFGLNGEEDTFRIYDHETEMELDVSCSQTITYTDNAMIGIPSPYLISFVSNHFEIQARSNPEEGGTVAGAGTYDNGGTATLSATANYGYTFMNWTKGGSVVSTNATYSFTVTASTAGEYVANFSPNPYTITATANPANGGQVEGGGTYYYGTTATLAAIPATGYHFVNWIKNGAVVSTSANYSFVVDEPASLVANFAINSYEITVSSNPTAGGTVTGDGTFNHFATCTLSASPNTGYHFVNWTKNGVEVSTSTTYSFEVTAGGNYVANFQLNSYTITASANPEEGGSVSGGGTFNHFQNCSLTATANEGYTFVNWTKNGTVVSTSATYGFTVTEAATYVANFQLNSYEITATANPTTGGAIAGAGTYYHFETCELTTTANEGYTFVNWTKDGEEVSTGNTISFIVTEAAAYVANFQLNSYEITATANPTTGGNITGAGTYYHFETCELTATANEGYTFVNWTKDGEEVSTGNTISFIVTEAAAYVANFSLNSYEITATANPTTGGNITGAGTYYHFETCTLTATASEGYTFVNWTKDGEEVSTGNSISFIVTEAAAYVANFSLNSYEITATANPTTGGNITGAGTYYHFETCTLTATASEGYTFVNWTKNGEEVGTNNSISFIVTEAAAYVANFQLNSYEITATANPTIGGNIIGVGTYYHFETCELTATANEGYTFVNWTKDGEEVSTGNTISFIVTEAAAYVANFSLNSYEITAMANPAVGGSVTGRGTFNHFETCTLTATANEGYTFVNWTKNGTVVSTSATYGFTVTEAATYVANFQLNSYEITATANPTAGGTITGAGTYNHFETCTLTVTMNTGYTFLYWSKDGEQVSTNNTISFIVTEPAAYVAVFEINGYEILATVNPAEGGAVAGAGVYVYHSIATLTATAEEGYTFVNWTKDGEVVATTPTFSLTVTESASYVANFSLNSYEITASANPETGGIITGADTYNHFETCTLIATANEGYTFVNWTKDGQEIADTESYSFTVTEAASFVAHFSLNSYEITATANPEAGGTVTGGGTYNHFETCTLTATANVGYTFVNWTKDGNVVASTPSFSFTITEAATYAANFSLNSYVISVSANPEAGGTVTGGGTYNHFETCTLSATANEGYTFINWTKDGEVVSDTETYNFSVTEAASYVAHFSLNSYEITATTDPANAGVITGTGIFDHGSTCTLTVTANPGYSFINWTKDGEEVSNTESFSFTVIEAGDYVANFEVIGYVITATANPEDGGNVNGSGVYVYGATANLTATANEGYTFVNWVKDGEVVATTPTYSITVTEAANLVANFQLNNHEISATANPETGGTITGAGTYNHFQTCTLTAIANEGYTFVNWTKDGQEVADTESYSFTVTEAASFVAHFSLNSYEITATVNPEAGGTVTGGGTYSHFETCTLTATANEGYTFVNWTKDDNVVASTPSFSFTVSEAATYVANFSLNSYEITATANPTVGGTITGAGTYNHFETCTLNATANEGYTFVNWTKDGNVVASTPSFSFTVTEAATHVANFILNSYEITATANPTAGGTITGAGTYNHFETCTLTATANTGYTFINWTKNGQEISTDLSISFTVEGPAAYVANFQINSYEITVEANPTIGGTAEGAGTYNHFDNCTLTATPSEGYSFVSWTLNGQVVSTSANYSFTVTGGGNYVANFSLNSYNITATANPTAGGTVSGAGTYNHFETCTLTATVNTGYTFINWTRNGQEVSTDLSISFMVEGPAAYVANFQINSYDISVSANPAIGGNVNGGGTYNYGTTATLTATASEGYTFVNWTKNGSVVSTSPNYSITVTESASYVANFSLNSYNITATANPTNGGTVSGAGTYNHFETCTLIATPDENYFFLNWTKNGVEVSTSPTYSFTVTEAGNYVANFVPNEFTINATAVPSNGGTVSGAGVYNYGTACTLTATPNIGFHFVNWTKDGVVVSTSTTYSFTVTENGSYVAHFDHDDCVITASAEPANGGIVTGAGTYHYNAICTLSATANTGYHFTYWTKDGEVVSNRPAFSITVTENAHYVAHFVLDIYYVSVIANPTQGGTVDGEAAYNYGESCTVTAFAAEGYHFVRWTINGVQVSTDLAYTFMVTGDAEVVGYFALNQYVIEASAEPSNAGSVSGAGTYTHGQTATLTATPQSGYAFVNWTKDGNVVSSNASYSFTVTESGSYVAHFTSGTHVVTTSVNPAIGGQASGAGTYAHGASCTVVATPNEGFSFVKWTVNGQQVSTQASYTFTVTENIHLKANFAPASCTITAEASPEEGGEVSGAGVYEYGDECTLNATANSDYVFVKWLRDGEMVSETPLYSFTVTGNAHYTAEFASNNCQVTATVDPAEGGTVSGTGTYAYGATVTLTVTPSTNYELVNWTENGTVFSTEETITFVVTGNRDFVAHMQEITGVEENGGMTVSLYPNPAKDKLTVEASEPVDLFEIYNINGALIYSQKDCADRIEVYVGDFAVGTYMIRLTTDTAVEVRRFVKE